MLNTKTKISVLRKAIKENPNGFTLKATTLKPYNSGLGCAVSITNIKSKKPLIAIRKVLLCLNGFKQIENNLYIGGWSNEGFYYLDLSFILEDKNALDVVGNLFKQIAYFNFKTSECINFDELKGGLK